MDSKSDFPGEDPETKKPVDPVKDDTLLDINEKQQFPGEKSHTSNEEASDIEAGRQAPKSPHPPLSEEEAQISRVIPMDNIRTIALSLITLQNFAIQAISTHRNAAQIHKTWPHSFMLVSVFVVMTRLLAVPLLFFVAGFSSKFSMTTHGRPPLRFALRRTWKTARTVVFYQICAYLAKLSPPLPHNGTDATIPYYASREGIAAMLNGPTAYVFAVLVLDYIYAILTTSAAKPIPFITPKGRYAEIRFRLIILTYFWVLISGFGFMDKIFPDGSTLNQWLHATNSADMHVPFLYLTAYITGIHFGDYYKPILAAAQRKDASKSMPFPVKVLFISLTIDLTLLYGIYCADPARMIRFFDVRQRPALTFGDRYNFDLGIFYSCWMLVVLVVVPDAMVGAFFTHPALARDWGHFSRTAHFQVYVQMLQTAGNPSRLFDDVLFRWLMPSGLAIYNVYYGGVIMAALGDLMQRRWSAVRRRISREANQPISM